MNHRPHTMEELGQQVAEHMGEGAPADRRVDKQAALRRAVAASKKSRSAHHGWRIGFAAAASIAVIISVVSLWKMRPSSVDYWVGSELTASEPGRWIKSTSVGTLPVRFENGDNLELAESASVRIITSDEDSISVALDSGTMTARVNEEHGSQFSVKAGPYWIYDIGTVFTVSWSPNQMILDVQVDEGLVHIVGGALPNKGVRLATGDRFRYPADEPTLTATPQPTEESVPSPRELSPSAGQPELTPAAATDPKGTLRQRRTGAGPSEHTPSVKTARSEVPTTSPTWAQHLSRGDYTKAVTAAKNHNLTQLAQSISQEELWDLAQAARYARDGQAAKRLLQFYRERFDGSPRAKTAAFLVGRVELELLGHPDAAADWFETYLSRAPQGKLAPEALGRLMQIYKQLKMETKMKQAARQYRQHYPGGLYEKLANSILGH